MERKWFICIINIFSPHPRNYQSFSNSISQSKTKFNFKSSSHKRIGFLSSFKLFSMRKTRTNCRSIPFSENMDIVFLCLLKIYLTSGNETYSTYVIIPLDILNFAVQIFSQYVQQYGEFLQTN